MGSSICTQIKVLNSVKEEPIPDKAEKLVSMAEDLQGVHCENIHSWISLVGDLTFSHQGGIYGFKFPIRFSGDLFLRSHSFTLLLN